MPRNNVTYFLTTDTDFQTGKLTGAHKRFLEFVKETAQVSDVILLTYPIPQLEGNDRIKWYPLDDKVSFAAPDHVAGMFVTIKSLKKIKKTVNYDYAVAFGPTIAICYAVCGYTNIISLFREDIVGYQKETGASALKKIYFRLLEQRAVNVSSKIIVQCENDKKEVIRRNKGIEDKIFVQINNVNASWMKAERKSRVTNRDSYIRIAFLGEFSDRRKGHDVLLPAISRLVDEGYHIILYVAGEGNGLQRYVDEYKKYPTIVFLGRIDNVNKLLSECDFEIVPSFIDSCPNTILEAFNAGIAVYGSRTGGIPDLLQEEKYMFSPVVDDIYRLLKYVIDQSAYIQDSIDQQRLKEKLTFDWAGAIRKIIEM